MSNMRPGPFPPPSTRGSFGFFCFGAGSIDSKDEAPPLESNLSFLVAGLSSFRSSASSSSSGGRFGSPIAIFFGARLGLGGGRDIFEVVADGGGRDNVDFLADSKGLATCGASMSLSSSLPLPYPSIPSIMVVGARVFPGSARLRARGVYGTEFEVVQVVKVIESIIQYITLCVAYVTVLTLLSNL